MKDNRLFVYLNGEPVGILQQLPSGKMNFSYEENTTRAISVSMLLRDEPYTEIACEAFFGGLLPESDATRKIIGKKYNVSPYNTFALLKAIGHDCAGAISFDETRENTASNLIPLSGTIVSDDELYKHIKALPQKPLFLGFEGLRLSLAGVHDKAAVCLIDNKIAIPDYECPTTHILKPATKEFKYLVENEFFCLQLAKEIGLITPQVEIRKLKEISYLLIERYDRRVENNNVSRIHQEDFCQALGIVSTRKYQNEGGPGFKNCFEVVNNVIQPAIDRNQLMNAVIFNFIIGNMDAHGKNFSLLYRNESEISLSPFYDLVCTLAYPSLTDKMAMKIGSQYEVDRVLMRHWEQLCEEVGYSFPALKKLIHKQSETILKLLEKNSDFMKGKTELNKVENIVTIIKKQINRLLSSL